MAIGVSLGSLGLSFGTTGAKRTESEIDRVIRRMKAGRLAALQYVEAQNKIWRIKAQQGPGGVGFRVTQAVGKYYTAGKEQIEARRQAESVQQLGDAISRIPVVGGPAARAIVDLGKGFNFAGLAADGATGFLLPLGFALFTTGAFMRRLGRQFKNAFSLMQTSFATLQKQAEIVRVVLGDVGVTTKDIMEEAIKVSRKFSVSQMEVANAMEILAKAGKDWKEIGDILPALIRFSTVAQMDMESATMALTSVMADFNLQSEEATRTVAILTQALDASKLAGEDLMETFKFIGPVAKELGFDLVEVAAAMEVISDAGIRGSIAGTTLRQTMNRIALVAGSTEGNIITARQAIASLGLEFTNADGTLKSFEEIIVDVAEKTAKLSEKERAAIIARIFGTRQMATIMTLMKSVTEDSTKTMSQYKAELRAAAFAEEFLTAQEALRTGQLKNLNEEQVLQIRSAEELAKTNKIVAFALAARTEAQQQLTEGTSLTDLDAEQIQFSEELRRQIEASGVSFEDLKHAIIMTDDEFQYFANSVNNLNTSAQKHQAIMQTLAQRTAEFRNQITRFATGAFASIAPMMTAIVNAGIKVVGVIDRFKLLKPAIALFTLFGIAVTSLIVLMTAILAPIALFGNSLGKLVRWYTRYKLEADKATESTILLGRSIEWAGRTSKKVALKFGMVASVLGVLSLAVYGLQGPLESYLGNAEAAEVWTNRLALALTLLSFAPMFPFGLVAGKIAAFTRALIATEVAIAGFSVSLGPIIAAAAALAVGGYLIYKNWDKVKGLFYTLKDALVSVGSAVLDFWAKFNPLFWGLRLAINLVERLTKAFHGSGLHWALGTVADMFKTVFSAAVPFLNIAKGITGAISMTLEGGAQASTPTNAPSQVADMFKTVFSAAVPFLNIAKGITGAISMTLEGGAQASTPTNAPSQKVTLNIMPNATVTVGSTADLPELRDVIVDAGDIIIQRLVDMFDTE